MNLYDTQLPANFSKALFDDKCMDLAPEHMDKILDCAVTGIANLLNNAKSMDHATVYEIRRVEGPFVVACVVQFFDNEDKKNPGNWNMTWTFDEKDIPKDSTIISIDNPQTHTYFRAVAAEKWGMIFEDESSIVTTIIFAFEQLKKWLDENVADGKEASIEVDSLFQVRAAVEGGVKVFAIEADGEIKNLIKDDAAIEK